jgi:hypothetical protein
MERERHRDIKNKSIGFLVLVRKQKKLYVNDRNTKKLALKAKGPYIVLEQAKLGSYWVGEETTCVTRNQPTQGKTKEGSGIQA